MSTRGKANGRHGPWTSRDIHDRLGIKARFLNYLAHRGYVVPSIYKASGSGRAHVYSFDDVLKIAICWRLAIDPSKFHRLGGKSLEDFLGNVRDWDNEVTLMILDEDVAVAYERERGGTRALVGGRTYVFTGDRWEPQTIRLPTRRANEFGDFMHYVPIHWLKRKGWGPPRILSLDLSAVRKTVVKRLTA